MIPVRPADVLTALNWRYAVKKFDPQRSIPAEAWAALEQSLVLSPSSYGLQPWKFVVVETPALRERLLPHSWNQRQVVDASHLVVFAVKREVGQADVERLIARSAEVRGVPLAKFDGYKKVMVGSLTRQSAFDIDIWMSRQVFIALGVFLATAAMLGVDACPMEGFEPDQYDDILGLTAKGYAARVAVAAGYRAADDVTAGLAKVRFPTAEVVERV